MPYYKLDTIVAQATPVGEGAIGIVRLSGPQSIEIFKKIFLLQAKELKSHHFYFGHLIHPNTNEKLDQVMGVMMSAPNSYTGEDVVEIHAHGNPFILCRIINTIIELGARHAEPGEFTKRAYLNGKMDLSQAEAVADLIAAKNEHAAQNSLSQIEGYLSRKIGRLRKNLVELLSQIEAGFDFVEEDIQLFQKDEGLSLLCDAQKEIQSLVDSFETGQLYKDGLKVALVGRPNVGKSSLLNVILNEDRAIIHHEPGTTRDVVEGERKIHGIQTVFYDTAGIRISDHEIEQEGIKRSWGKINKSDVVCLLLDSSEKLNKDDQDLIQKLNAQRRIIYIVTKIDLPPQWSPDEIKASNGKSMVRLSSKTEEGILDLLEAVYKEVIHGKIKNEHNYVLNNVRHKRSLDNVLIHIQGVIKEYDNISEEFLVEELRIISSFLGEIIGEIDNEEILDEIFSRFCIGK